MNTHWHCVYVWIAVPDFSGRFELFLAVLYRPIVVDRPFDCVLSKIDKFICPDRVPKLVEG